MRFYSKWITNLVIIVSITVFIWVISYHQYDGNMTYRTADGPSSPDDTSISFRVPRRTSPAKNVVFLKVHKVGGSTLMNMFYRYANSKHLNLVVPIDTTGDHWNYLGFNITLHTPNIVPLPRGEEYNILCNHVIYDKKAFSKIMPKDSVYLTILRNPADQFVSAAMYYNFLSALEVATTHTIGKQPIPEIFHEYFLHQDRYSSLSTYHVRNPMSHDLGLPMSSFDDKAFIQYFIGNLSLDYNLVMLMEHFTESVILMRRYLSWSVEDVIFIPLNVNHEKKKKDFVLYNDDIDFLSEWNYADFELHRHFEQIYMMRVEAEGPSLQ
ncbi:galactose-3-O-sulfotransferase 2-like [Argopecten irradians]|uniref:galactose-3-O-sulfotransferase 2-like n=1 Tax=Argopecten irradians TaxID=31199 RepID=UPI00370FBFD9